MFEFFCNFRIKNAIFTFHFKTGVLCEIALMIDRFENQEPVIPILYKAEKKVMKIKINIKKRYYYLRLLTQLLL